MSFRARDDATSPGGSGDDAGEMELDALEFAALANATSPREETASSDAFPRPLRRPLRRSGSTAATGDAGEGSGDRQATRLLEALEALSSESGGPMPPSLRSLLGQLQGDESAMAGLYPFMQLLESHGSHPRFHRMLQALDADAPPHVQLSGLSDLCESLSMSSEESLVVSGFSVDKFLPPLLQLVRTPSTMEVLLLAARALASMLDLFPTVAIPKAMADKSVSLVDSICAKLLEIEYMDVAELFFQILEKIVCSAHHASETVAASYRRAVIEANGFVALLQFVDFFPIEIQRTAARVVAGLCLHMNGDFGGELQIALPLICGLLRSSDADMVTHGCRSFQALSASAPFRASPKFAALVASDEICESLVQLMESFAGRGEDEASVHISVAACVSIVQFLSAVLAAPHHSMDEQVARLRHARLPLAVAKLVALPTIVDDVALLRETLQLVIGILPPTDSMQGEDEEDGSAREETTTVRTFMRAILPCVVHIFEVSSRHEVRYDCLGVILRVCLLQQHFHDPTDDDIAELAHLASFLARVLRPEGGTNQKTEGRRACMALQIVQACLHCDDSSLSAHAQSLFERHGVSAVIRRYAKADDADEGEGVGALSRLLVAEYLGENLSSEPSMEKLRSIVRLLDGSFDEEEDNHRRAALADGLGELLALCRARQEVSTSAGAWLTAHELASSGLARSLHRVLQDADARRVFGKTFLGGDRAETAFLDGLIASVQDAISVEKDAFRVDMYAGMGSTMPISTGSVTSDMDQLVQHIKVRVKIEEGDGTNTTVQTEVKRNKRSVHDTVVLVEPLARIDTIEEFIAERLFGSRSPFGALDDGDEEEALTRRHHRRAARRRDNEAEEKHADGDENEEDEQEMEEAEEDPEEEEDDHDHEHDDDHDHDDEDESSDLRSDRPQKQKRLQVLYGGTVLRSESSVLEAILKTSTSTTSDSSTNGSGGGNPSSEMAKVWTGAPHEFVFRVMGKENGKPLAAAQVEEGKGSKEEVSTSQLPSKTQLEWWDDVWDLLGILKQLHDLLPQSKTQQLVNAYISLQITRALTQPVRVMTHSLPSWSFRIVEEFPFVLEYETRYDFLFATTSGAPRAISYLCRTLWKKAALAEEPQGQGGSSATSTTGGRESRVARRTGGRDRGNGSSSTATAALTNLSRMAKLPRLKVRVARSRLLQSAMKLFSMYGGKKAIIEIEFLGEVGTGLGPTTEFYTLVCHELQAAHLKLWRNDKDVTVEDDEAVGETGGNSISDVVKQSKKKAVSGDAKKPGLPVRGYHRVAVYHCTSCKHLEIPRCAIHDQLLTHEKIDSDEEDSSSSIPQCARCLDTRDWHSAYAACKACCSKIETSTVSDALTTAAAASEEASSSANKPCTLKWWILSDEETTYLRKVFPRDVESIQHPVLQCAHCDTVNFPGTDAGIVVLDASGERMVSRAGRRMYERDYRAVTKHVSPLCEGTPLKQVGVVLTRDAVETLVDCVKKSPELLDSEVESLCYMSEVAMAGEVEVVDAPFGLFPKPYKASMSTKKHKEKNQNVLSWFNFMGRFVAQSILDERLVNLPLSRAFLRALRGEDLVAKDHSEVARSLVFVREIDPAIAQSLTYLSTLAEETTADESSERNASLVESMGLAFTLVGDGTIELCENGKRTDVTLANVREYVRLNVNFLVHDTIQPYVAAFHDGFQTITGCHDARTFLQSFSLSELEFLLADKWLSGDSMWDREGKELRDHMVCDHGYTPHSRAIHDLVAILCELPLDDQRLFVKFVTGANRLPLGGLAKLEPKLTVVRKLAMGGDDSTTGSGADAVLPSASTCTNYLKLPEYSTRETMEKRLAYCIREGQGSFHLS